MGTSILKRNSDRTSTERPLSFLDNGYPTRKLLLAPKPPVLTENKIVGSYDSVLEYVQIHYDLLLEDFMHPLRRALREFKSKRHGDTLNGARVYRKVCLKYVRTKGPRARSQTTCTLDIDASNIHAERPTFGCLLVFTRQDLDKDLFLGTVISYPRKVDDKLEVQLKFSRHQTWDDHELSVGTFTMIEAEAFFYVYFHVLRSLRALDISSFPMRRYIIDGTKETQIRHPAYLTQFTSYRIFDQKVQALNPNTWPQSKDVKYFDESQYKALRKALTEEVAVIQGPPGTGKTYFGVKLVKILLDNMSVWNPWGMTPLLIVCQSNLAVDHFLEGLQKYHKNFVRVGDQCHNREIKPHCLKELVLRDFVNRGRSQVRYAECHLDILTTVRRQIKEVTEGIVSLQTLQSYGIIKKAVLEHFTSEELFLSWLGLKIKVGKKFSDSDLTVSMEELTRLANQLELAGDYAMAVGLREEIIKVQTLIAEFRKGNRPEPGYDVVDIPTLSPTEAQRMYLCWIDKYFICLQDEIELHEEQLNSFWEQLPSTARFESSLKILRSADVIGMTSTGAASRQSTLQELQSPIVIIEEAAEVLESHVVVSMTDKCKHLILLGDHKQLKPGVTTHHLATQFHLNVSLFERLVNNEIVEGTCLTKQYRMRPEISSLLKPHIYKVLIDAPETKQRPPIRGVAKNMFFLDHKMAECKTLDETGCWNPYEVDMLIGLAKYLVSNGYAASDITVIAMYSEQKRKIIEARDDDKDVESHSLRFMQVASVDSFQGKENEIVLLSLVRSNNMGKIGFLKEENRICVALSRARAGLYIIGNLGCLTKRSQMWRHVKNRLNERDAVGSHLSLVCDEHKTIHKVSKVEDWGKKFCQPCAKNERRGTASIKPVEHFERVAESRTLPVRSTVITPCTCCRSYYCKEVLKTVAGLSNIDFGLSSGLSRLQIAGDSERDDRQPRAQTYLGETTDVRPQLMLTVAEIEKMTREKRSLELNRSSLQKETPDEISNGILRVTDAMPSQHLMKATFSTGTDENGTKTTSEENVVTDASSGESMTKITPCTPENDAKKTTIDESQTVFLSQSQLEEMNTFSDNREMTCCATLNGIMPSAAADETESFKGTPRASELLCDEAAGSTGDSRFKSSSWTHPIELDTNECNLL